MFRSALRSVPRAGFRPLAQPLARRTASTTSAGAAAPSGTSDFFWCARFLLVAGTFALTTTSLGIYIASRAHPMLASGPIEKNVVLPATPLPAPPPSPAVLGALERHPLHQRLMAEGWKWSDAWRTLSEEELKRKLIPGTYAGERRIEMNRIFTSPDGREMVSFLHIGTAMCGFPGVVHGGVSASVIDEAFGRVAIAVVGGDAVTATLGLRYRRPVIAGREGRERVVVCRARVEEVVGRKVKVTGGIEGEDGRVLVEGEALFVVPKGWKPKSLVGFQ